SDCFPGAAGCALTSAKLPTSPASPAGSDEWPPSEAPAAQGDRAPQHAEGNHDVGVAAYRVLEVPRQQFLPVQGFLIDVVVRNLAGRLVRPEPQGTPDAYRDRKQAGQGGKVGPHEPRGREGSQRGDPAEPTEATAGKTILEPQATLPPHRPSPPFEESMRAVQ